MKKESLLEAVLRTLKKGILTLIEDDDIFNYFGEKCLVLNLLDILSKSSLAKEEKEEVRVSLIYVASLLNDYKEEKWAEDILKKISETMKNQKI